MKMLALEKVVVPLSYYK